jgi:hypothetical protein
VCFNAFHEGSKGISHSRGYLAPNPSGPTVPLVAVPFFSLHFRELRRARCARPVPSPSKSCPRTFGVPPQTAITAYTLSPTAAINPVFFFSFGPPLIVPIVDRPLPKPITDVFSPVMQWLHLLAKFSPERVQPILREGRCKPPDDYKYVIIILRDLASKASLWPLDISCRKVPIMPFDHHDPPPEQFEADDQDESSSIGDSSLLAPPMSHRQPHNYPVPHQDLHQLQPFLDGVTTSHDPPVALATTLNPGSVGATMSSMRAINHSDYPDGVAPPNYHPPHPSWMHGQAPLSNVPPPQQQPLVYRDDGYAPAESLPPQNYVSPTRAVPSPSAPHNRTGSRGAPLFFLQAQDVTPPALRIQTAVVPPNSELARSPRFTFAPPGAYVPADPITTAVAASPTSVRSWRDKGRARFERPQQQPTQEGSGGRARSHSWTVVSSVFRRRSGVYIAWFF